MRPTTLVTLLLSCAGVILGGAESAGAASAPLPGTGADASGNVLPGGSADPFYTVTGPGVSGVGQAVVYSPQNVFPGWVPDDAHSAWIGFSDNSDTSPHGNYTYELKLNLIGFDPATASVSGNWSADQFGSISLNGQSTGVSVPDGNWDASSHPNLTPFATSSGFQSGVNALDFIVNEPDGFDGLRVRGLSFSTTIVLNSNDVVGYLEDPTTHTVTIRPTLFGDINLDGKVNNADFFQFKKAFGSSLGQPNYNPQFDFNGDGEINNTDFFQFKKNFGMTYTPPVLAASFGASAPVPEPTAALLLLTGAVGFFRRSRVLMIK